MRQKVTVVGAGNVGATCAQELARRDYADVVLVDIKEGVPQGKALDMMETAPVEKYDSILRGTNGYDGTEDSDVVVITAGLPRKPGMSRDDLLGTNCKILSSVAEGIKTHAPNSFVIVITNPLDAMVTLMQRQLLPMARLAYMCLKGLSLMVVLSMSVKRFYYV